MGGRLVFVTQLALDGLEVGDSFAFLAGSWRHGEYEGISTPAESRGDWNSKRSFRPTHTFRLQERE